MGANGHTVLAAAYNFQGGQYKKYGEKTFDTECTTLYNDTFQEQFEKFQSCQKYPVEWKTCPYPTGPNEIRDYFVDDYTSMLPPYIPGGEKWKLEYKVLKDDELLGGANLYLTLRNEKSLLG